MSKTISLDIRERVAAMVDAGHSARAAARHFGVSESFAIKLIARLKATGDIRPARQGRPLGTGKLAPYQDYVLGLVAKEPDITLAELCVRLEDDYGIKTYTGPMSSLLRRAGLRYKKLWSPLNVGEPMLGISVTFGRKDRN